jgi:hypothetical protein
MDVTAAELAEYAKEAERADQTMSHWAREVLRAAIEHARVVRQHQRQLALWEKNQKKAKS